MTLPTLYTVAEIAEWAGCATSTVYGAINRGELVAKPVGRKHSLRVTEAAARSWMGIDSDPTPAHGIERRSA